MNQNEQQPERTAEMKSKLDIALSQYFPYQLKGLWKDSKTICDLDVIDYRGGIWRPEPIHMRQASLSHVTPILRPLSDLTVHITHRGRTFIPAIDLFGEDDDFSNEIGVTWKSMAEDFMKEEIQDICVPLSFYDSLNEWRFDYRGLINQGLAISVHDLPENPYNEKHLNYGK